MFNIKRKRAEDTEIGKERKVNNLEDKKNKQIIDSREKGEESIPLIIKTTVFCSGYLSSVDQSVHQIIRKREVYE